MGGDSARIPGNLPISIRYGEPSPPNEGPPGASLEAQLELGVVFFSQRYSNGISILVGGLEHFLFSVIYIYIWDNPSH